MSVSTGGPAILTAAQVVPRLEAASFGEMLDELAAFAAGQPHVTDGERLARDVADVGADDTIAASRGAFVLHFRSDSVSEVVVVLGVAPRTVRVPAGREGGGRVFALVAAPPDTPAQYLRAVATIASVLRSEGVVDRILESPDPDSVVKIAEIRDASPVRRFLVVDVMEPATHRVNPDTPIVEAAQLLARGRHRGLPVVNRQDEIVGMIAEKDLIDVFLPGYLRLTDREQEDGGDGEENRRVRDVMAKTVMCLPSDATISEAASMIVNRNVDPLPVTRDGKWIGLISRRSLIRKLMQFASQPSMNRAGPSGGEETQS